MTRPQLRIAFCAANDIGSRAFQFAAAQAHRIEFVATCAADAPGYQAHIEAAAEAHGVPVLRHADPNSEAFISMIREREIDLMILAWWPGIIKPAAVAAPRIGWLNMHPSLLPIGRGKHPYYWSIVERKAHGVTLHLIDEGIDTGPILFQETVPIAITDTGEEVYRRSNETLLNLFLKNYSRVALGDFAPQPQDGSKATFHWGKELAPHSALDLERSYTALDLINILRARTFSSGPAARFELNGEQYEVRINIRKVDRENSV